MMRFNIITWTDNKITYLKDHDIHFNNGIPKLPRECIYNGEIKGISTHRHRADIPCVLRQDMALSYYMFDNYLWPRLYKVDEDIEILKEYAAVVGMDLSPSIYMLRPRQKMSILINAVHACYCGLQGVKIVPNYRAGDFGTICAADYFPDDVPFFIGQHGCNNNVARNYGDYILDVLLLWKSPPRLYFYGNITMSKAGEMLNKRVADIITFPDRRNRVRNGCRAYRYYLNDRGNVCKEIYGDYEKRRSR